MNSQNHLNSSNNSFQLSSSNIETVLRGATILSGGGGGSFEQAFRNFNQNVDSVEVRALENFEPSDTLVTVFGLGPVDNNCENPMQTAQLSVELFEKRYDGVDGIVLGELGPDLVVEAAMIADELGVPVVNADVAGMRAVPSIQNEIIEASDLDRTPLVATNGEDQVFIEEPLSGEELEERIRQLASEEVWYITGYGGSASEYMDSAAEGWLEECIDPFGGRAEVEILGAGNIQSIESRNQNGHTVGRMVIQGQSTYTVFFRNENIVVETDEGRLAEAPDTIAVVTENGFGIYNGDLPDEGIGVTVLCIRYPEIWDEETRQIFNPDCLSD